MPDQTLSYVATLDFTENPDDMSCQTRATLSEAGVVIIQNFFDPNSITPQTLSKLFGDEVQRFKGAVVPVDPSSPISIPGKMINRQPVPAEISSEAAELLRRIASVSNSNNLQPVPRLVMGFNQIRKSGLGPWMPSPTHPQIATYIPGRTGIRTFNPNGPTTRKGTDQNLSQFFETAIKSNNGTAVSAAFGSVVLVNNHGAVEIGESGLYIP